MLTARQSCHPLIRSGNDTQAGHDDRALDTNEGILHVRQGLDDAPRMCCRMPGIPANDVSPKCQIKAASSRRIAREICQNLRSATDHEARHWEGR